LLYSDDSSSSKLNSSAILWGRLHEVSAFEQYETQCLASGLFLRKCGIFVSNLVGFIAASLMELCPQVMEKNVDSLR
jgi:hypothetical protein